MAKNSLHILRPVSAHVQSDQSMEVSFRFRLSMVITLKAPSKIAADDAFIFTFIFRRK